jgi:hypothetical protein
MGVIMFVAWILLLFGDEVTPRQFLFEVEPFDVQLENDPRTYFSGVDQLEYANGLLFLRDNRLPFLQVFDRQGHWLESIGQQGNGPGESTHIGAFAVDGADLILLGSNGLVHHYQMATPVSSFKLDPPIFFYPTDTHNFAFSAQKGQIILEPRFSGKHLGRVFDLAGKEVQTIPVDTTYEKEDYLTNPWYQSCFWLGWGKGWLAVSKHLPFVFCFDEELHLLDRFALEHQSFHEDQREHQERKARQDYIWGKEKGFRAIRPLFIDAKMHQGDLYLLKDTRLFQVDMAKKRIASISEYRHGDFERVAFTTFALCEDGTALFGHTTLPWDHDLWLIRDFAKSIKE